MKRRADEGAARRFLLFAASLQLQRVFYKNASPQLTGIPCARLLPLSADLRICLDGLLDHAIRGKNFLDASAPSSSHASRKFLIAQQLGYRAFNPRHTLVFDEHPALALFNDLSERTAIERDGRNTVAHRREQRRPQPLELRWKQKHVQCPVNFLDFFNESRKNNRVSQSQLPRQFLKPRPARSVARKQQTRSAKFLPNRGQRTNQPFLPFVGKQHANIAKQPRLWRNVPACASLRPRFSQWQCRNL